jgi:hypothetical protein
MKLIQSSTKEKSSVSDKTKTIKKVKKEHEKIDDLEIDDDKEVQNK